MDMLKGNLEMTQEEHETFRAAEYERVMQAAREQGEENHKRREIEQKRGSDCVGWHPMWNTRRRPFYRY
jgi:hypothetical protein